MVWKGKFDLRQYEHKSFSEVEDSERRQKLTKKRFRIVESPLGLIIIGITSVLILLKTSTVMQDRGIHNLLKLLYSGLSILALIGVLAIPLGIYRFIKRKT